MNVILRACATVLFTCTFVHLRAAEPKEISNFALIDHRGEMHELRRIEAKAIVLFFTGNGCPVARQTIGKLDRLRQEYEPKGVTFLLINANSGDDRASIAEEMRELKVANLPVLKDDTQGVARHLGVRRTGVAIAIKSKDWTAFYRGAVDDQMVEGAQKPAPAELFLQTALDEFLAGKPITRTSTVAHGCAITFEGGEGSDSAAVSYAEQVIPILKQKCVHCHSPGNIGSWSMANHRKLKSMGSMIEEVILTRRMPPWDADPTVGTFRRNTALTISEAQTLLRWIHQGSPRGEGDDPLPQVLAETPPAPEWPLGKPDKVIGFDRPEKVPATGIVDYRNIDVAVGNSEEVWLGALAIRPGNRKIVHHVVVRMKDKEPSGGAVIASWSPGITQGRFPTDSGKLLPKGSILDVEMHYTTNGAEQEDRTEIGLYFLEEKPVLIYEALRIANTSIVIRPGDANSVAQTVYAFPKEVTLHGVKPHMHLRGKSMKFELLYPDGRREIIASVPRFDFNWQTAYRFEEPKRIPAGTWALITGVFDNSALNPANPNPKATVYWGPQSFDEMFVGYHYITRLAEEQRPSVTASQ
jgi:hypothetical protein